VLIRHARPSRFLRLVNNTYYLLRHIHLAFRPKLLYALTPPPWIQNIGDQAQVLAILAWFQKAAPGVAVWELNQSESAYFLPALSVLLRTRDVIFLHSGGNLGDRYMGTESARRLIIQKFPRNKIVSLPQTICFSDTPGGQAELKKSSAIYGAHRNLTLICRDRVSARTATGIFPDAKLFCLPDFVLSLPKRRTRRPDSAAPILICRRRDQESLYSEDDWHGLATRLPLPYRYFDTRFPEPIQPAERRQRLAETLNLIEDHRVVVTDRFHAIIFAILCRRPCVALPTIDHKVTASRFWFRGVLYASNLEEAPALVAQALDRGFVEEEDWNAVYFDRLPALLGLRPLADAAPGASGPETSLMNKWRPVAPYQQAAHVRAERAMIVFEGQAATDDEWCYLSAQDGHQRWGDLVWTIEVCKYTDFREFAFNFRCGDFDNRYRYRFEAGRLYFDKRLAGRWYNHLSSVPFNMVTQVWYRLRIEASGDLFSCFVDDDLIMQNADPDLAMGGVAVVLWESDGKTVLNGAIRNAAIRELERPRR
jgi:pyruvyl transferase EpsI